MKFAPYEDFLGLGTSVGFSSIVIPGSGSAQFDTYEANPFETNKQRSENLIHKMIEKLDPSSIVLDQNKIGTIDRASAEVLQQEKKAEMDQYIKEKKP